MRVIICGAGQVGYGIAERLSRERIDVTVIDAQTELINTIRNTLDVRGIVGHGAHPDILAQAGADEADMLIAVTLYDEVNMVACQVAHSLFNVPTKVARIRAQNYLQGHWADLFSRENLPIDVVISPEIEVGEMVLRRLSLPGALEALNFADGAVMMMGISCEPDCPVVDTPLRQLSELFPDLGATVVGIMRQGRMFAPHSDDALLENDLAYVVVPTGSTERTLSIFGHDEKAANRIVIAGGGNIGRYVANALEMRGKSTKVKVIEANKEQAVKIAGDLKRSLVLHGNSLDMDILQEADIKETDTIVALTNNDQANILSCVMAKELGCKRNLSLVNDPNYPVFARALGIDAFISPRGVTTSRILQYVRRGRIRGVHSLHNGAAEIIEAEALETSPLVGKTLRELNLPEGVRIGALYRDKKVIAPDADTVIAANDRAVVFATAEYVGEIEQLFRVSLEFFG